LQRKKERPEEKKGTHDKQHADAQAAMWRRAVTTALALGTGAGAAAIATSDDPAKTLKICTHLPPRLLRDSVAAATIAFDYQRSLFGLEPGSEAYLQAKRETHLRSANRLQELCFRNGGIYIKLGQHIAQLVCTEFPTLYPLKIDLESV
jgi:aarF domain-containing kinase